MQPQYFEVPNNILTGKDLDYLSDMFEWNSGAVKKTNDAISSVNDQEISQMLQKGVQLFDDNLNVVLDVLAGGGTNEF